MKTGTAIWLSALYLGIVLMQAGRTIAKAIDHHADLALCMEAAKAGVDPQACERVGVKP